jgi:hypothetical protein
LEFRSIDELAQHVDRLGEEAASEVVRKSRHA